MKKVVYAVTLMWFCFGNILMIISIVALVGLFDLAVFVDDYWSMFLMSSLVVLVTGIVLWYISDFKAIIDKVLEGEIC